MSLCAICTTIFHGTRPSLYSPSLTLQYPTYSEQHEAEAQSIRSLHSDISQIADGALAGCQICDLLWRHFFRDKTAAEYLENPIFLRHGRLHAFTGSGTHYRLKKPDTMFRDDYGAEELTLEVGLNSPMDKDVTEYKEVAVTPVGDEPAVDMASLPHPDPDVYGKGTWSIIENWVRQCKSQHTKCNDEAELPVWYPTRLLDLGERGLVVQAADCKLIETAETPVSGVYMTLSHRWNPERKECTTTNANIAQRKEGIKAHEMPKIFEEAVCFTRRLGIRYLWIDSLCIVQGDPVEWKREACMMDRVYAHSMLNLEGTVGGNSLLQPRQQGLIAPCIVQSAWEGLPKMKFLINDLRYWDARIQKSVCNTRAWITQERYLTPRVLHFTFDQLLWECRELEAGEAFPSGLPKEAKLLNSMGFKKRSTPSPSDGPAISSHELRHGDWQKVLLTYGRTEVTKERDRLIAVAGIATKFSSLLKDEWIAGLWRKTLPGDLLWYIDKTRRMNKPPPPIDDIIFTKDLGITRTHQVHLAERLTGKRYQAPSWSWASVLGDICMGFYTPDGSDNSMIDILDVQLTPEDPSMPMSHLSHGKLRLRGTLYPLAMDPPDWTSESARLHPMAIPPTIYLAGLAKKSKKPQWPAGFAPAISLPAFESHSHTAHLRADEPVDYHDLARSCYLPVRKYVHERQSSTYHGQHLISGLALMPTGKRGEYVRLGRMDFGGEDCELFEDGLEVQRKGEESAGKRAHPETMKEELYVDGEVGVFEFV
ncbi:HET-domain-containing protein [Ophiobolus disseminans]|uniref:HET-domain-containing protein n=1 Tax=Ophiobolus disseminans TaxID=1469910 RepID=A0A6A7A2B1_9PLEO|nr:HET-domain-containing protein [Ophiobolus disseminans]